MWISTENFAEFFVLVVCSLNMREEFCFVFLFFIIFQVKQHVWDIFVIINDKQCFAIFNWLVAAVASSFSHVLFYVEFFDVNDAVFGVYRFVVRHMIKVQPLQLIIKFRSCLEAYFATKMYHKSYA